VLSTIRLLLAGDTHDPVSGRRIRLWFALDD
jgi:hypothetical protein